MKKILSLCLLFIITATALVSCGAVKESVAVADRDFYDYYYSDAISTEAVSDNKYAKPESAGGSYTGALEVPDVEVTARKQIKNATMRIQTKEYDAFMDELSTIIYNFGGYVQSSSQNGANYGSTANRSSRVVARIPAESFDAFKSDISEKCNVVYLDESVQDITVAYTSIESRIAVLEAEESSLVAMLENAQKYIDASAKNYTEVMSTMLQIKDQLTRVQSELAAYRAELKSYASQVAYSTISMTISEVDRLVVVEEPKTVWEEIGTKLSDNLYSIGQGARSFFVWFVTSLPYLLIWAVILGAIAFVLTKTAKRVNKKHSELKAHKNENNDKTEQK